MQSTDFNDVTLPSHYQFEGEITEVRDVIRDRTIQYVEAGLPLEGIYDYNNIIKYTLRAPLKNGIEDFKKARYCLDSLISLLEVDAEAPADQPAKYGYGVLAVDVEVDEDDYDDEEEDNIFNTDVMADVITRVSELIKDRREEKAYNMILTGLRSPQFRDE